MFLIGPETEDNSIANLFHLIHLFFLRKDYVDRIQVMELGGLGEALKHPSSFQLM